MTNRKFTSLFPLTIGLLAGMLAHTQQPVAAQSEEATAAHLQTYQQQIKPLLRESCYACHGGLKQEGGLRLDTVESMRRGGDSGEAISPNDVDTSYLLERVGAEDPAYRMPPEHEGEPLSDQQVALIRGWIEAGAPAPEVEHPEADPSQHWAFQPIVRPDPPEMEALPAVNPIDLFIADRLRQAAVQPLPEAGPLTLLRRLHLDLVGLPPPAEKLAEIEQSPAPDWYEREVDSLLDSPGHGERWGRHWMDIWRYSDWWGLNQQLRNSQKHMWHWRDWIVESLNRDTPYDEMLRMMLAADELCPDDLEQVRATGFLARNFTLFNRAQWMDETVEHVSKGLLGLTMNCARCHDHKYDPLPQAAYYRFRAFFEPYHVRTDVVPGQPDVARDGIPRAFDGELEAPTFLYIRGDERQPDRDQEIRPGIPEALGIALPEIEQVQLPPSAWQPARRQWVMDDTIAAAQERRQQAWSEFEEELASFESEHGELHCCDQPGCDIECWSLDLAAEDNESNQTGAETASDNDRASARLSVWLARADAAVARASLDSLRLRADAQRASWRTADDCEHPADSVTDSAIEQQSAEPERNASSPDDCLELEKLAIRGEQRLTLVEAQRQAVAARLALAKLSSEESTKDKRKAGEEEFKKALEGVQQARGSLDAELPEDAAYQRIAGAVWSPTRFETSAHDDPTIDFPRQSTGRRSALAEWITDNRNPLTARVAVNHLWTRHMGKPLVASVFDFGRNGSPPTHPELLDWLASELIDSGWSMKHVHRLIVTSAVYRRSSSTRDASEQLASDPDNITWWRREPIRLESQVIRDSVLALAGRLDSTMGGPSVPTQQQTDSRRRSLYFFHSNNERDQFLTTFDEARVTDCYRREQSVVPQQALALTNSQLTLDAAQHVAERMVQEAMVDQVPPDDTRLIQHAFRRLVGMVPSRDEIDACRRALEQWRETPNEQEGMSPEAHLMWALVNHNDFVTLR